MDSATPETELDRLVGRRLQARGREQVHRILEAGAAVFAEQGVGPATTSAIAERAGISPGSLYQFFANKEAIVDAVAQRYLAAFEAAVDDTPLVAPGTPTREVVDSLVDPLVAFNLAHPGFGALLAEPGPSQRWATAVQRIHDSLSERLDEAIGVLRPDLDPEQCRLTRELCILTFKAVVQRIMAEGGVDADRYIAELKRLLTAYLDG